ncbi:MAG TPA: hypothetical protein VIG47_16280 [Gemmatimonadaceae bacterium]|jgi:hypothetical protein
MYDDLSAPEDHSDPTLDFEPPRSKTSDVGSGPVRHLPDREVPLPNSGAISVLHQWLDGDVSVAVVRASQGGNDAVDLWTKIHDEAETLRSRTTPLYVHKRIMDSLPDDTYRGHHPWYKRSIPMSPALLVAGAIALIAIGAVVANMVLK